MKKGYAYAAGGVLLLAIILLILIANHLTWPRYIQKDEEQYRGIYMKLQNESFYMGKYDGDDLILYDDSFCEIKRIELNDKVKKKPIAIAKKPSQMRFVSGGAVDDEYGIVFVEGETVDMSGIYSLRRLSGNSYYYETR